MTTAQDSSGTPSQIHIEGDKVFEGTTATKVIDLEKNRQLAQALATEGRSSAEDWPNGNYRVEGDRLVPVGGMSS